MARSILVVCVGNICRSPMAQALLQVRLPDVAISSAGTAAPPGAAAASTSIALMAERGIDISGHSARQIDSEILQRHELVLTMEQRHTQWLTAQWPYCTGRVYRWGHWGDFDIADPYRKDDAAFTAALELIDTGLEQWELKLAKLTA